MKEGPDFADGVISELLATLSKGDGEVILRRINTDKLIRLVAQEFVAARDKESIRILTDSRVIGEAQADLLVQVDDYDIRIQIIDTPKKHIELSSQQLAEFHNTLQQNPSTIALLAVWTTDDLLSLAFTIPLLERLIKSPEQISKALEETRPLGSALEAIVNSQELSWDDALDIRQDKPSDRIDSQKQFLSEFSHAISKECSRSYRSVSRRTAAEEYPSASEKRIIETCLQMALEGATADKLHHELETRGLKGG